MSLLRNIQVVLSLVRRDYAVQFAGTGLGLAWMLVQYGFQIGLFFLVFGVFLGPGRLGPVATELDYAAYLTGAMSLWLPLSEMLLRSASILADNRGLIRRTNLGLRGFLLVPVFEAWIHYALIFGLVVAVGLWRGTLVLTAPLAFLWGTGLLAATSGWAFVFARVSILLKDVSPLLRLGLQLLFWATPVVYVAPPALRAYFPWNPLYAPLELHRALLYGGAGAPTFAAADGLASATFWSGALVFAALSVGVYVVSARRLSRVVLDQL